MSVLPNGRNSHVAQVEAGPFGSARYVGHTLALRTSPAWKGLPDNARRIVDRLEVQHMNKGLKENGALCCTYVDFAKAGLRRSSIRRAIEEAVALGFVEIVRRGYSAKTDVRVPSLYRLTHVLNLGKDPSPPTNKWATLESDQQVRDALRGVLAMLDQERDERAARKLRQKQITNKTSPGHEATL